MKKFGGGRVLQNYVRLRWAILRLLIFHPWKKYQDKYSAMQNILPWQIYIPDKYSLLKYINP